MENKMTTDRAIELLRCRDGVNFTLDEYCEALDMAVEALKKCAGRGMQRETDVFKAAIEVFGEAAQVTMVFEEMAELQKELCKWMRNGESVVATHHIAEEIADVEIMLDQMKLIFDCVGLSQGYRRAKTARLAGRIEKIKKNRADEAEGKNKSHKRAQETTQMSGRQALTKSALGQRGGMMNESTAGKLAEMVRRALKDPERRQELLKLLDRLGLLQGDRE